MSGDEERDLSVRFPPHVIRDYAFLGDGERGAIIGPAGDVAFLCAPAWDSDAVFSTLIGGSGCYAVTPAGRYTWGGYYDPRSLIWNDRWVTTDGIVESRDALALPTDPHTVVLLRRVRALQGRADVSMVLDVRAGFGRHGMRDLSRDDRGVWTGRSGGLTFRWWGGGDATRLDSGGLSAMLAMKAGDQHDLVLEISDRPLPAGSGPTADHRWEATESGWRRMVGELPPGILAAHDAQQALAVLTGMTSAAGGMTAAATMSLPERARAGRNYDYRYAWIRDQCYAARAVAAHREFRLLDRAVGFVAERLLADGPDLKPAYTVTGGPVPDERALPHLAGYPGGADKAGNWANKQFQLDAFGEALELFAVAADHDRLDTDTWRAVEAAVAAIEARWHDADAGIWEIEDEHWTHSRLTCASGLRLIAAHAPGPQAARWSGLADAILTDASSDCLHPSGRWQRNPDDARVDAALLLPAIRGALPGSDPRSRATVAAVEAELVQDDYVYRFRPNGQPLGELEGAFLLCNFLLALSRHQQGDPVGARALFERARATCGSPGLFAEEFDVAQRQLRGNLPQAFVHALLLECAAELAR